ncbi:MAG: ATP-binding protein [Proteobacteria bacterium]|nr:ATP-binding protein [Pseudomonadota bacterium]
MPRIETPVTTDHHDEYVEVPPNAGAFIEGIRSLGYTLTDAVADIVDNSITAGASLIDVDFHWNGADSWIRCTDNGTGMSADVLKEAMRIGSRSPSELRADNDLGRFGLGLKTASFSQSRRLSVRTREAGGETLTRCWDVDRVIQTNRWQLLTQAPDERAAALLDQIPDQASGTVVLWEHLDRIQPGVSPGKASNLFLEDIADVTNHLSVCFHRFLGPDGNLTIRVNGETVEPWDPFHEDNDATLMYPEEQLGDGRTATTVQAFVIPRSSLPSVTEASGYTNLTPRQGFYVYRERRLLVAGGWLGLASDHDDFALARIRVDITNAVDREWKVDVRKSKAVPPPSHTTWLKGKAQRLQETARAVLRTRKAGGHGPVPGISDPVWHVTPARGSLTFRINRAHPILNTPGLAAATPDALEALLVALETSIPVALLANPTVRTTERKI